jgi:hypothetical protein
MNQDEQNELKQALTLTRQLLVLVRGEDWEAAATVEAERFHLLRQGIAADKSATLEFQVEILREIEQLNVEIENLSRKSRSELSLRLREMHNGRKAGKAYRQL